MFVSYFLMDPSRDASGTEFLILFSPLLPSPLLVLPSSPPHPAQLRLHLSPATEAPTPADPPPRVKKQRTEVGKGESGGKEKAAGKGLKACMRDNTLLYFYFHFTRLCVLKKFFFSK